MTTMKAVTVRKLSQKEIRLLRNRRAQALRHRRTLWQRTAGGFLVIFGLLALITLWAEPAKPRFVLGFWAILGGAISVPIFLQEWRRLSGSIADLEFALTKSVGEELIISSTRYWEFEEQEDEGACYAFELKSGGVIFVCGQDYYSNTRFPTTDFSLLEVRNRKGLILEGFVVKRGEKTSPEKLISAREKEGMTIPEHGSYFSGSLEEVVGTLTKKPN